MTDRFVKRRRAAEQLAAENRQLYADQRGISEALQRALLPNELPVVTGLEIESRYLAGLETMNIGGDWYDVIACDDGHVVFVVGDVSGRGRRAFRSSVLFWSVIRPHREDAIEENRQRHDEGETCDQAIERGPRWASPVAMSTVVAAAGAWWALKM